MPQVLALKNAPPSDNASIRTMFDRLAGRYDLFNALTSFGMDTLWRARALSIVRPGQRVLDLGCGTGDLTLGAAERLRGQGEVVGLDLSPRMLEVARARLQRRYPQGAPVRWIEGRAEDVADHGVTYDAVLSGFVLRNLRSGLDQVLVGLRRSTSAGAPLALLDFTEPRSAIMRRAWRAYMDRIVPLWGKALFGGDFPEGYMAASAACFDKPEEMAARLRTAGLTEVRYRIYGCGSIVLYNAVNPERVR